MEQDIVIVSNSPGELSALVKPLVNRFRLEIPHARLTLVITPCAYASGNEIDFAKELQVDQLITPKEYFKWAFFNLIGKKLSFSRRGVVLFTGGDLFHAVWISWKLRYKACAYLNERIAWARFYSAFFVPDQQAFNKFSKKTNPNKITITGNLMVDSILSVPEKQALQKKYNFDPAKTIISFFPGSRPFQIQYLIPFYERLLTLVAAKLPQAELVLSLSPFVKIEEISRASTKLSAITKENHRFLFKGSNYKAVIMHDNAALVSDLVVTIPGTNTAQNAALGTPMLVIFPLDKPEVIPLEGIADYIGRIPLLGKIYKQYVAEFANQMIKYFALPNMKANREIVPEMRGTLAPEAVAEKIFLMVNDKPLLEKMKIDLKNAMGKSGAANMITNSIKSMLEG